MDKLTLFGKEFAITEYKNATPTSAVLNKKSAFSDAILFNVTYDLSGVSPDKDWDDLTPEEKAKVSSLRARTPIITAKDTGLRNFALKRLNKGKDDDSKMSLADLNTKLFAEGNFDDDGVKEKECNTVLATYEKTVVKMLTDSPRTVYYIQMSVSELTNGKVSTWTPEYSDKPQADVVAYEVDADNLLNAAMSAVARMFATLDTDEEEGEE